MSSPPSSSAGVKKSSSSGSSSLIALAVIAALGLILVFIFGTEHGSDNHHLRLRDRADMAHASTQDDATEDGELLRAKMKRIVRQAQKRGGIPPFDRQKRKNPPPRDVPMDRDEEREAAVENARGKSIGALLRQQRVNSEMKKNKRRREDGEPRAAEPDHEPAQKSAGDSIRSGDAETIAAETNREDYHQQQQPQGDESQQKQNNNNNNNHKKYAFELDAPRFPDEEAFFHDSSTPVKFPPIPTDSNGQYRNNSNDSSSGKKKFASSSSSSASTRHHDDVPHEIASAAAALYHCFKLYDDTPKEERRATTFPVVGQPCVGRDCPSILQTMQSFDAGVGHWIVIINSDSHATWLAHFRLLESWFKGRMTVFHRPDKLSCAESWNLITRCAFVFMPASADVTFVQIANADWGPKRTPRVQHPAREFVKTAVAPQLHLVVVRYHHFSSFAFTRRGFDELRYFDENIYPALTEDVEFHLKAVSKGLGELGGPFRVGKDDYQALSYHFHRQSQGDKKIDNANHMGAKWLYVYKKWNVGPFLRDMAKATPFKHPFNLPFIHHNNSWVVDQTARACLMGKGGPLLTNSHRCYWDPMTLRAFAPKGQGVFIPPARLAERMDRFFRM